MSEGIITLSGFSYRYPEREERVLDGIDLEIGEGELVLCAGLSGSGKSTLLRTFCGLVPHFFGGEAWGEATVAGLDCRRSGPAELSGRVGYCAQEAETQVVSSTVGAEIELPLELAGVDPVDRARAVEEVSLALGLDGLLERTTDGLSGGELQRVALAASLVARPLLIVLDEPTSQLDPVAAEELLGLLRRINEQWGTTIVLCEHRVDRCLPFADRVIGLERGRIAIDAGPREFLRWAVNGDSPLATPIAELCARLDLAPPPRTTREARALLAPLRAAAPDRAAGVGPSRPEGGDPDHEPLLAARGLGLVAGKEKVSVLEQLDLEIAPGERVAVMGRNGAGKTTLLRALARRREPGCGEINGEAAIAFLPQWPGDLILADTVAEEFALGSGEPALERNGLADLADRDPRDISGGERQRLAMAIATAGHRSPVVMLLDEPTLGMDRARKAELRDWLAALAGEGSALVVATHDAEFAAELCDRIVLIGRGRVLADGPPGQVLSGGWYFSTDVARAVDLPGVVTTDGALAALAPAREPV